MALTSNQRNFTVFFAAAGLVVLASALFLGVAGNSDNNIELLLRASARAALLVLLFVFVARPSRQLLVTPATAALLKNRRLLGIAFAGIHTSHLGLIFYRDNEIADFELNVLASLPGAISYMFIYLMLITSFDRPARAIGRKAWKVLHKTGLYWVFGVFTMTQLPRSLDEITAPKGIFLALIGIAVIIRLTAFFAKRRAAPA